MSTTMAFLMKWVHREYELIMNDMIYDDEIDSWFTIRNPIPLLSIIALYLGFVLRFGPKWMKNRKPFELKQVLVLYNLTVVLVHIYFLIWTLRDIGSHMLQHQCTPPKDRSNLPRLRNSYDLTWYFCFVKLYELADTVFMILRKKNSQISFLHVNHHFWQAMMPWLFLKFFKAETGFVMIGFNAFMHILVYLYYFVAAVGIDTEKYIWFKKQLTMLQMMNFVLLLGYLSLLRLMGCKLHRLMVLLMYGHTIAFLTLFLHYYYRTYIQRRNAITATNASKQQVSFLTYDNAYAHAPVKLD